MSKSTRTPNGCVYLKDDNDTIMRNQLRCHRQRKTSGLTVRKSPVSPTSEIYSACTGKTYAEIEAEFQGKGYGDFKPTQWVRRCHLRHRSRPG